MLETLVMFAVILDGKVSLLVAGDVTFNICIEGVTAGAVHPFGLHRSVVLPQLIM